MNRNVIIMGAGFSFDAGIPLLSSFVDTMWETSVRKTFRGKPLSGEDADIFARATKVRTVLDGYHGRAHFDDRNIEDILSILSFGVLTGSYEAKGHLEAINRAIARTIELSCTVTHSGIPKRTAQWRIEDDGPALYRGIWHSLFKWRYDRGDMPTLITFNYDLVLERSLLQLLIGRTLAVGERRWPRHLRLNYHFDNVPSELWTLDRCQYQGARFENNPGTVVFRDGLTGSDSLWEIDLIKLHGSLNFPMDPWPEGAEYNVATSLTNPFVLPPIFNKLSSATPSSMWKVALERVSKAHNLIIVGYSLPISDIYMQYFFKAALGPNVDINRIIIFNPALGTQNAEAMKERYSACFSPQLRSRIEFVPSEPIESGNRGSTAHFAEVLNTRPEQMLF